MPPLVEKSYTIMDCLKPLRSSCSSEKSLKVFLNYYFVLICLQWLVNPSLPICPCLYPHFKEHKHTLITFLYCQYTLPDACMLYNCHHHAGDEEHVQMPRSLSTSLSLNFPRKMAATFSRILTTATLKFNDPFIALMRLPCFHQNSFKCACKWLMQDYIKQLMFFANMFVACWRMCEIKSSNSLRAKLISNVSNL